MNSLAILRIILILISMTKQAEQILHVLNASPGHMTADELYLACRSAGMKTSVASVYRVANKLAEEGAITRIHHAGGPDVFDKTTTVHEHLFCSQCGAISDLSIDELPMLIEQAIGMKPESFNLSVNYICESCRKKE